MLNSRLMVSRTVPGVHHILYNVFDKTNLALWYAAGGPIEHGHHYGQVPLLLLVRLHKVLLGNAARPLDAVLHGAGRIAHIGHLDEHAAHEYGCLLLGLHKLHGIKW